MDDDFDGFQAAHIFPLCETDIVSSNLLVVIMPNLWCNNGTSQTLSVLFKSTKSCLEMKSARLFVFVTGTREVRQVLNWNQPICKFRYFYLPFLTTSQDNFHIYEFIYRDPRFTPHGETFDHDLVVEA